MTIQIKAAARLRATSWLPAAISYHEAGHQYSKAAFDVLAKMAATINHADPGPHSPGTYSKTSCYGKVAQYLRAHQPPQEDWFLLLFRPGTDPHTIAHVCLYDGDQPLVDLWGGHPIFRNGLLWYQVPGQEFNAYPLTACLGATHFFKQFVD